MIAKQLKDKKGFTLVEVIISIAVLSIASVFILQMFVTSAQLNANARDIDKVNMWTSTLMETFHMTADPMAFDQADVFTSPEVTRIGEELTITCFFDKNWQPIAGSEGAEFALIAWVSHEEDGPSTATGFGVNAPTVHGALYTLEVTAQHLNVGGRDVQLGHTVNTNYFLIEEVLP